MPLIITEGSHDITVCSKGVNMYINTCVSLESCPLYREVIEVSGIQGFANKFSLGLGLRN